MDECDGGHDYETMEVDEGDQSCDAETDATETSEHRTTTTTNSKRQKQQQKSQNSNVAMAAKTKTAASRRLVMKTPGGNTPASAATPVSKRTRCQKASLVKIVSPHESNTPISSLAVTRQAKSTAKSVKRGSAISSKGSRKTSSSGVTGSAAASAAGEVEQQQQQQEQQSAQRSKRERRARRCLNKTEPQQASPADGIMDDDSSSNFSPEDALWKGSNSHNHSTETVYTRNCRK